MPKSPLHLYTLKEAAAMLGGKVSVDTLRAELADGHLQCVRMREDSATAPVLFTAQQLLDWVELASKRGTPHNTREKGKKKATPRGNKKGAKNKGKKAPRKPARTARTAKATRKPKAAKKARKTPAKPSKAPAIRTRPAIDSKSERRADLAAENPAPIPTEPQAA